MIVPLAFKKKKEMFSGIIAFKELEKFVGTARRAGLNNKAINELLKHKFGDLMKSKNSSNPVAKIWHGKMHIV